MAATDPATLPISCFIIAKNEADRIGRTIASVRGLAREIVVVDSGSTDGTQAVAEAAGAKVVFNAWPGFGQQKRFAELQCQHDWLLNIDADEVVTVALADEIRQLFASGQPPLGGYWMSDQIIYPGTARPRRFARDHYFLRLYDRRRMRFAASTLHVNVDAEGQPTGHLSASLHHHSVRSFDDLIAKNDERASYNAAHAKAKGRLELTLRVFTELPTQFFKYYIWRTHVLGGVAGFQYAAILAFFRFVRIVRMREGQTTPVVEMNELNRSEAGRPGSKP